MTSLRPDLLEFIARHIDSVAALDVLLLFRRSPETFWAPAAVADKLGIAAEIAASVAARLYAGGLLARAKGSSAFRFAPRDASDRVCVEALSACCAESRTTVLDAIRSRGARSQTSGDDVRA